MESHEQFGVTSRYLFYSHFADDRLKSIANAIFRVMLDVDSIIPNTISSKELTK